MVREQLWRLLRPWRSAARVPLRRDNVWFESDGGWRLFGRLWSAEAGAGRRPGLLLIPSQGAGDVFEGWGAAANVRELAGLGWTVFAIDLAGRGRSWGVESHGGAEHHADVRAALRRLAAEPSVDPGRIGVVSFGLGASAVAGALAAPPGPVAFWIDVEGPSDREMIAATGPGPVMGHPADDDRYWWPREPVRWMPNIRVPYLRYQARIDPALGLEHRHAERMIRAADEGAPPLVQINEHAAGEVPSSPRWMPPGTAPAQRWLIHQLREWGGFS